METHQIGIDISKEKNLMAPYEEVLIEFRL